MNEMDALKNRWREAKGTRTFPDIAEAADLAPSTVEYAFSPKATNPSFDTVVRISRELHVSLDETFGILSPSDRAEATLARQDAAHWKSRYETAVRDIEYLRTFLLMLGVFFLVLVIWCVTLDLRCADIGFFRGEWNFIAVFSVVCFAIAALIVVLVIVRAYRRHKQRREEK
nr:MAG TPA: structural protein [Caudoviricetes sp.]